MRELVIIAGPQAAGKSTIISGLSEQYHGVLPLFNRRCPPRLFPLQESRQIVVHKYALLGAIFMTREHELEVAECDLGRMDLILGRARNHLVYIDECNVFTLAHAAAHGITGLDFLWDEYMTRLEKLNAKVIFIDVPPEISWERRRAKYEQRLVYFEKRRHKGIISLYHDYIVGTYERLKDVYRRVLLPKEMVDGRQSKENVLRAVSEILAKLSASFR